jgi:hypothetical protein
MSLHVLHIACTLTTEHSLLAGQKRNQWWYLKIFEYLSSCQGKLDQWRWRYGSLIINHSQKHDLRSVFLKFTPSWEISRSNKRYDSQVRLRVIIANPNRERDWNCWLISDTNHITAPRHRDSFISPRAQSCSVCRVFERHCLWQKAYYIASFRSDAPFLRLRVTSKPLG